MKENTVLLHVEKYNQLRDFYNGIHEGKFVIINSCYDTVYYREEKDVLRKLKNRIEYLDKKLNAFKEPDKKTINDLKKMNLLQFLKWRYR